MKGTSHADRTPLKAWADATAERLVWVQTGALPLITLHYGTAELSLASKICTIVTIVLMIWVNLLPNRDTEAEQEEQGSFSRNSASDRKAWQDVLAWVLFTAIVTGVQPYTWYDAQAERCMETRRLYILLALIGPVIWLPRLTCWCKRMHTRPR